MSIGRGYCSNFGLAAASNVEHDIDTAAERPGCRFFGFVLIDEEFIRNFICRVFAVCLREFAGDEQRI
jgi:hypothetical protein